MQERRKHQRFKVSLPIRVTVDATGVASDTATEDMSEGGVAFVVAASVSVGTRVHCVVRLSASKPKAGALELRCRVVRVELTAGGAVKMAAVIEGHTFLQAETASFPGPSVG